MVHKPIVRMFAGKEYVLEDVRNSFRSATRSMESYHDKGCLARVTKITARRFGVWVRRPKEEQQ